jgi:3-hydroxymyristoyl/3-hydroxydecanoyl-(acyl carrier protein) dehydratase
MNRDNRNTEPRVLSRERGVEARFVLELRPEDLAFQGHFPGDPILPGVVQLDWAIRLGHEAFGPLGAFQGLQNLKFMDLTRPGEKLELVLAWDPAAAKLGFRYSAEGGKKSSGIVCFMAGS